MSNPKEEVAKPHVSVVLPTWNERENIGPLIKGNLENLDKYQISTEIIVVDDDSPDGTWQLVEEIGKDDPRVKVIRRIGKKGLTSAIRDGIRAAKGDIVVWMDCDLSMPPSDVPRLVKAIDDGADLALGSRYVKGGKDIGHSFTAKAFSRTINFFASLFLGFQIHDYTSGFIAARREIFKTVRLRGDYGEYCIDMLHRARMHGYKLVEIPYDCVPRFAGESKTATSFTGFIKRGINYVITILRLRFYRPSRDKHARRLIKRNQ